MRSIIYAGIALVFLLVLLCISSSASATDRYLDGTGTAVIQAAINSCAHGDTLYVSNTTHTATANINWNKRINVIGNGTSAIISVGANNNRVYSNMNITNLNFTITSGNAIQIQVDGIQLNFYNCRLYSTGTGAQLIRGVDYYATLYLENTVVRGTGAGTYGIRVTDCTVTMVNSIVCLTSATANTGIYSITCTISLSNSCVRVPNDSTPVGINALTTSVITAHNSTTDNILCTASTVRLYQCSDGFGGEPDTTVTSGTIYSYERINISTPISSHLIQARYSSTLIASYLTNATGVATLYSIPSAIETSSGTTIPTSTFNTTVFAGVGTIECFDLNTSLEVSLTDTAMNLSWTGTNHYFDLLLNNTAPQLFSPTRLPTNGTSSTEFVFVVYSQDIDIYDNISVNITIDGTPHSMIEDNILFVYSTTLAPGLHNYNFTTTDGALLTTTINYTVFVNSTAGNYPPVLLGNTSSNMGFNYSFFVYAFDPEFDPITVTFIFNGTPYVMNLLGGNLYNISLLITPGTYNFSFNATDSFNYSTEISGNLTVAEPSPALNPVFGTPVIIPPTGLNTTLFNFLITCIDPEMEPLTVTVIIDSTPHTMTQHGSLFSYFTTLPNGDHDYTFNATADSRFAPEISGTFYVGVGIILVSGQCTPSSGNTTTLFNFTIQAYCLDSFNLTVSINNINHTMLHYSGPTYYYSTLLPLGNNTYTFYANTSTVNETFPGGTVYVSAAINTTYTLSRSGEGIVYPFYTPIRASAFLAANPSIYWVGMYDSSSSRFVYYYAYGVGVDFYLTYGNAYPTGLPAGTVFNFTAVTGNGTYTIPAGRSYMGNPTNHNVSLGYIFSNAPGLVWISRENPVTHEFDYYFRDAPVDIELRPMEAVYYGCLAATEITFYDL